MSWIRLDCSTLDDEFTVALTGDEFKAWCMFLLRMKAQGSRGRIKHTGTRRLSKKWNIPTSAVDSMLMLSQQRGKIRFENGYWVALKWYRYGGSNDFLDTVWRSLRQEIFKRDDYTCFYCGRRGGALEIDHKMPISRSGSDDADNLVASCVRCNRKKGAMTADEFIRRTR